MEEIVFSYSGKSMKGTFKKGDLIIAEPYSRTKLHEGDVIVFRDLKDADGNVKIIHRIVNVVGDNLFTCGDSNWRIDILPVSQGNLIGKVTNYERNGKRYSVTGGIFGLIHSRTKYYFRKTAYWFLIKSKLLIPIQRSGNILMNEILKLNVQKIKVSTKDGQAIKWIFRNRTIAQMLPGEKLQRYSILSYFLVETKNHDFPSDS